MAGLSAVQVKSLGEGRHPDAEGLHLLVKASGARSWMLRIQAKGIRRDLGLGSAETATRTKNETKAAEKIPILDRRKLTLSEARLKATAYRKMIDADLDPVVEQARKPIIIPNFEKAARDCHDALKKGWRNQKHTDVWLAALVNHIFPAIGATPVNEVTSIKVRDALAPIWLKIPETARRALQRIGAVLDFAHIHGWRSEETSLKSVRKGLPRQPQEDNHFDAMPYGDAPAFVAGLATNDQTVGRQALQLTIFAAVRSNETRFAVRSEFDLKKRTWTIPAARMKMNQIHVVPLCDRAIEIVQARLAVMRKEDTLLFCAKPNKPISDMTMTKVLRDDEITGVTVHGFRSSFTDWAAEETEFAKEVVDKALAHKLPDRVEAAYRRTDFFEKRRALMDAWGKYLGH